jgi:hypothetical protein
MKDKLDLILNKLNSIEERLSQLESKNNPASENIIAELNEYTQDDTVLIENTGLSHADLSELFDHIVQFGFKGYETRRLVNIKELYRFIGNHGHKIKRHYEQQIKVQSESQQKSSQEGVMIPTSITPILPKKEYQPDNPEQYNKFLSLGGTEKRYQSLLESGADIDELIKLMESE